MKFEFIEREDYKTILENDYNELNNLVENKIIKSAAVMAGSIIEALLTDFLIEK